MNEIVDPLWPLLSSLLQETAAVFDDYGAGVCRAFVSPGETPAWDVCCPCDSDREGQLWVAVQRFFPVRSFPSQEGALRCRPEAYAAEITMGALRCAATVDESGEPPSGETLTLEAAKVSRDRVLMQDALLCRWPADLLPGGLVLRGWRPLGPQGGCVGGLWEATIAVSSCDCLPEVPHAGG